ncbi:MAG: GNAT family N-acetyltransferase [Nanoarchaeota archaeon]|nr:GNAT family N-acetyltransferase [Nanoarchaeota archaeon]
MKIRKARKQDEKEVVRILNEYDKYESALDKRHKPDSKEELSEFFNKLLKSKIAVSLVLEIDSKIVGFISGEEGTTLMGKNCKIHQLIISEECRGKGYGKKLLKEFEDYFKKKGCNSIQSFVLVKNKKVLGFYNKLNYSSEEEGFLIRKKIK